MAQSTTYARPQPDHTKDEPAPALRRVAPKFDGDLWLSDLLAVVEFLATAVPSAHGIQARVGDLRTRLDEMRAAK